MASVGQLLVTKGLSSIPSVLAIIVYLILIPLMVFFFLKDREQLIGWFAGFLPEKRPLLTRSGRSSTCNSRITPEVKVSRC